MVIFHSYVKLPEGTLFSFHLLELTIHVKDFLQVRPSSYKLVYNLINYGWGLVNYSMITMML